MSSPTVADFNDHADAASGRGVPVSDVDTYSELREMDGANLARLEISALLTQLLNKV